MVYLIFNDIIYLVQKKVGNNMKVVLTTLNSKFIHSCLAIRYLKSYVANITNVEIREYTINQNLDFIASDLYKIQEIGRAHV